MLGKRSGKEKEGDLGALLFSLHFSIASAAFFFFLSSPKRETEQKQNVNRLSHRKYYRRGALSERRKQEVWIIVSILPLTPSSVFHPPWTHFLSSIPPLLPLRC